MGALVKQADGIRDYISDSFWAVVGGLKNESREGIIRQYYLDLDEGKTFKVFQADDDSQK